MQAGEQANRGKSGPLDSGAGPQRTEPWEVSRFSYTRAGSYVAINTPVLVVLLSTSRRDA